MSVEAMVTHRASNKVQGGDMWKEGAMRAERWVFHRVVTGRAGECVGFIDAEHGEDEERRARVVGCVRGSRRYVISLIVQLGWKSWKACARGRMSI
jgi:hypothetical protein